MSLITENDRSIAALQQSTADNTAMLAKFEKELREIAGQHGYVDGNPDEAKRLPKADWEEFQEVSEKHVVAKKLGEINKSQLDRLLNKQLVLEGNRGVMALKAAIAHFGWGHEDETMQAPEGSLDEFLVKVPDSNSRYAGKTAISWRKISAAMTKTGTGAANESGAAAIDDMIERNTLIEIQLAFGGIFGMASRVTTDDGNIRRVPNVDTTSQEGIFIGENTEATDLDMPALGNTNLGAHIAASRVAELGRQFMRDSSFDVVAWVRDSLLRRIMRAEDTAATIGDGNGKPDGFVNKLLTGHTTSANNAFTWQELLHVWGAIDDGYMDGPAAHGYSGGQICWAMNKKTLTQLLMLADMENRPLYLPNITGGGNGMGMMLFGYPIMRSYKMPDIAAGAKPIAFGNFSYYLVRTVNDALFLRFDDSAYAKRNVTGFLGFNECDGRWIQALTGGKVTAVQALEMAA